MKILIAGSRNIPSEEYEDIERDIREALLKLKEKHEEVILISGAARGIDSLAAELAQGLGIKVDFYPAQWSVYGRGAGMIRNKIMVEKCDLALIYWDGSSSGTANTIEQLKAKNKKFFIYYMG